MIITLLALVFALPAQANATRPSTSSLLGKWVTTAKPGPGEAPAIAPTFTITSKENKFYVAIDGQGEPLQAVAFRASRTEILLVIRTVSGAKGGRMIVIRPVGIDQLRFELFNEYPEASRQTNFYYAEVFKREAS